MLDEETHGWAALDALALPPSRRAAVLAAGGAYRVVVEDGVGAQFAAAGRERPDARAVAAAFATARRVEAFLDGGGRMLGGGDVSTLGRLGRRARAPLCLYARGDPALLDAPRTVAIVGSRACSDRGRRMAYQLGVSAAEAGVVVVSGGARGVDEAAHEGALRAGGRTIAILGEHVKRDGVDERPFRLRKLLRGEAAGRALTATVYGPYWDAQKWSFAARNEWVASLADVVVVVEGAAGSGTRHTLKAARDLGVRVASLAGRAEEPLAATPNRSLREGAEWIDPSPRAVADLFGLAGRAPADAATATTLLGVVRAAGGAISVDDAAQRLGADVRDVLSEALLLELEGVLEKQGATLVVR